MQINAFIQINSNTPQINKSQSESVANVEFDVKSTT